MKRFILFICMVLVYICTCTSLYAKSDYKNPISTADIGKVYVQITQFHKPKEMSVLIAIDKYQNHFLVITVNYFINKGKDVLNIAFNNGQIARIPVATMYKRHYKTGTRTWIPVFWIGFHRYGGYYRNDVGTFFYSCFPLTEQQYDWLISSGIQSMSVDNIYKITYNPLGQEQEQEQELYGTDNEQQEGL